MTDRRKWSRATLGGFVLATMVLVLIPVSPAEAVQADIVVTVQDGITGDPLAGATVTAYPDNQTCPSGPCADDWVPGALASDLSDVDGIATLTIEQATLVTIRVTAPGYEPGWVGDSSSATTYFDAFAYTAPNNVAKALIQKRRIFAVTVLDSATVAGVSGATVGLYLVSNGEGVGPVATAIVDGDEDADFQLKDPALSGGVPYGSYKIRASAGGYAGQWLSGTTNDWAGATVVDLSDGAAPGNQLIWLTAGAPPTPPTGPATFTTTPKPTISGKTRRGKVLTAHAGSWVPAADAFTYRWYRGTKAIKGATARRYKLTAKDVGKRIVVKIRGIRTGYVSVTVVSAKTRRIRG
jgi:hypothetical protein